MTGGKLGDILGPPARVRDRPRDLRRRLAADGAVVGVASLTLGWSILEGIGAAIVLPALAALVAGNFEGKERAAAYGVLGGVVGRGDRRRPDPRRLADDRADAGGSCSPARS